MASRVPGASVRQPKGNAAQANAPTSVVNGTTGKRRVSRRTRRNTHRLLMHCVVVTACLLLALVAGAGWLTYKSQQITQELRSAEALVTKLEADLTSQDTGEANRTMDQISLHTSRARVASEDPVWRLSTAIPILGANFTAVSELVVAADDVVHGSARPLLKVAESLRWQELTPVNGKLNIDALQAARPAIASAANTMDLTYSRLAAIEKSSLLPEVAGPLEEVTHKIGDFQEALATANNVAKILPPMMGANEARNYLVLVQNSAEIRATGGLPGALALIRVDNGSIELVGQSSGSAMGKFSPAVEVDDTQVDIYSSRLGSYISDVNLTPDFPTAARTAKTMWETRHGGEVDGVVAIDPVVLAHILEASGPISLPTSAAVGAPARLPQEMTAENVVSTLLSDVYGALDTNESQDAFFAAASQQIFEALASGQAPGPELLKALTLSVEENRLHVWSDHNDDQQALAAISLGGAVSGPSVGGASFGVYFNDGTGAKMDYYVRRTVQVVKVCTNSGYAEYKVKVHITNTAPSDAASVLPVSVTGDGRFGTPPGTVQTNVVVYGPALSHLDTTAQDGQKVSFGSHLHDSRPVGVVPSRLAPGESSEIEMTFVKVVQHADPTLTVTPTVQEVNDVTLPTEYNQCD